MIIKDISILKDKPLGRSKDLSKQIYENCKAIKRVEPIKIVSSRDAIWLCQCNCGNYFITPSSNFRNDKSPSCGCLQKKSASENLSKYQKSIAGKPKQNYIGYKSGKLTVISFSHIDKNRHSIWNCQCECGNTVQIASPELSKKDIKSCGCLKQSYGSFAIEQVLLRNNILFEKEKTFETCRFPNTNALAKFDFYVNNQYLIEFDGKQHFEFVGGYYTLEDFHALQKRDQYKNEWCKNNNVPLIRIPYFDEEKISLEYLKERGLKLK